MFNSTSALSDLFDDVNMSVNVDHDFDNDTHRTNYVGFVSIGDGCYRSLPHTTYE